MTNTKLQAIEAMIQQQTVAYLSSLDEEGYPQTRAMLPPRKQEGLHTFYFTTNTSSQKAAQYRKDPHACLYFSEPHTFRGIMLLGTAEVLEDKESRQMIWRDGDTMYYAKGVDDPDYCVVKFSAKKGRFYEAFHTETFPINE